MASTHELSQAAFDRLKTECDDLTTRGRVDIARKIETARELGDLKENGDYHAAKEEQGKMEGRIIHLEDMIENAIIVEDSSSGGDTVTIGAIIEIQYEGDDTVEKYLIGSIEERQDHEVISPGSPLGKALVGASLGETVDFEAPGGTLKVKVVEIS